MHSSACAFKTDSLGEILNAIILPSKSELKVYPNPSDGIFQLEYQSPVLRIEIFNLQGILLKKSESEQVDISEYENGIYVFKAHLGNQKVVFGKLIKAN